MTDERWKMADDIDHAADKSQIRKYLIYIFSEDNELRDIDSEEVTVAW